MSVTLTLRGEKYPPTHYLLQFPVYEEKLGERNWQNMPKWKKWKQINFETIVGNFNFLAYG